MRPSAAVAAALLAALPVPPVIGAAATDTPYAGEQARPLKALSARDVDDLLAGRGMGLAKPAELNGYPGPAHVLEHADALALSPRQRERTQALHAAMQRRARALGGQIVARERALEAGFARGSMDAGALDRQLRAIAELQGRLRAVHLQAHLRQKALLTDEQLARYAELRGYARGHAGAHGAQAR